MAEADPILPFVDTRDHQGDPDHYLEVLVTIENLKKCCGKVNACIDFQVTERSFSLSVEFSTLKGSGEVRKYLYKVKRLPANIVPDKSSYKVKKGQVVIKLRKAVPESWIGYLDRGGGLEQDTEAS